jgi:diacylglycerol kinase family enzyme
MGLLVLLNRAAGTADDEAVQAVLAELRTGADVEVAVTGDEDELREALAGRGERRPVVVGGDGSAHAAVCALDRLGALDAAEPLGLVARGTGHDRARAVGLPLDPVAGARAVLSGVPRPLDLVRDDAGGLVLNAVHAGIGARAHAEATRVKAALETLSFPLGALVAGVVERSHRVRVEVDGRVGVHERAGWAADGSTPVLLFAVSNGPPSAAAVRSRRPRRSTTGWPRCWSAGRPDPPVGPASRPTCCAAGTSAGTTWWSPAAGR